MNGAFGRFEAETGKPIVALVGPRICMGGGVGVSVNARRTVVSPGARFAMPETAIGFCPDVGATHWLAAAPGRAGECAGSAAIRSRSMLTRVAGSVARARARVITPSLS